VTYAFPGARSSYAIAVELLESNSVKGSYAPKKLYEGKEIGNSGKHPDSLYTALSPYLR
jgi:hypothetical protein